MGVNGLWTVIQPCARPTNLATLNQKRLAVDASIWIYQFLKAVRDKEGNALRNSHVVGFFRRICKLLWFGIRPVFVFDGGAPTLKRQTITGRKQRREGRRDDAVRTAGKLLAVQMQRIAEEEEARKRRRAELEDSGADPRRDEPAEELPDAENLVYVDELGMNQKEKQTSRRFFKQDAYHLPDLDGSIQSMGRPEDPRIMSIEDLEEYARQFQSGEDINLYDFSKIDFEGEFFKSLPAADRYNILNAARMRSRLRMGLSKEQLDGMFPDRMAFSRFQIERVAERNHLTQRLMQEAGMTGTDLTLGGINRVAGERDREYILVKNEGAEGGWALGVVSKEKDRGEIHKPIDVDALDFQYQNKDEDMDEDDDFEDVPIEGLNRLPKVNAGSLGQADPHGTHNRGNEQDDSLFVDQDPFNEAASLAIRQGSNQNLEDDEEEDLNRAIALSMRTQHGGNSEPREEQEEDIEFEDVEEPRWDQRAVDQAKPITSASGSMIAHIVNNRANATVPKPRPADIAADSDSEDDLRTAFSKAKKKKDQNSKPPQRTPQMPNVKNPFAGPLPFEKLDWKSSIFGKKPEKPAGPSQIGNNPSGGHLSDDEAAGGFEKDEMTDDGEAPRPLPPWMQQDDLDIRDSMKAQRERENEINEADREAAMEEEKRRRKDAIIEIQSSDEESDVEEIAAPPPIRAQSTQHQSEPSPEAVLSPASLTKINPPAPDAGAVAESMETAETQQPQPDNETHAQPAGSQAASENSSPEPEFEEVEAPQSLPEEPREPAVEIPTSPMRDTNTDTSAQPQAPESTAMNMSTEENELLFGDGVSDDEFSDPEEEELMTQMAAEAEEHARFASQLNNKSEKENQEAYEQELKALRTQQKKDRRDADEVTQIMITECQALLRFFGIPYITAPMEAEAQCAELVSLGLVDGIVTDDSDIFLFGGTRVYKNMFNSNKFVECYLGQDLEKELSLSREQLISLAHLLGSDYTEGLPGVGPVTAVEILSEFPGKDGLSQFREWWQDVQQHGRPQEADRASTFRKKFRKAQGKKLFLPNGFPSPAVREAYLEPEVDHAAEPFQWGVPDVEGLRRFLMSTIGWSQERTDEVLVPVIRDMNRRETEGTQSNITRFFGGSVGTGSAKQKNKGEGEAFAPRQRTRGAGNNNNNNSKRMTEAVNKLRAKAVVVQGMMPAAAAAAAAAAAEEADQGQGQGSSTSIGGGRRKKRKARNSSVGGGGGGVADDDEEEEEEEEEAGVEQAEQSSSNNNNNTTGRIGGGKGKGQQQQQRKGRAKRVKAPAATAAAAAASRS